MVYPKMYQGVIDFVEEATGKPYCYWIKCSTRSKSIKYQCSECKGIAYDCNRSKAGCSYKFCPHCGREMWD